jgi:broad specificity phosphatase PhoE
MAVSRNSGVARIFLIRHADAAGYREDPVFGNHLTALGMRQAQALAERVAGWQVGAIVTSDLHRAYETAIALHQRLPLATFRVDPVLREFCIRWDEIPRDMPGFLRESEASSRALERRLAQAWELILSIPCDVALVISHRRTIKYLIGRLIGHDRILKSRLHIANASITAIEISRSHRTGTLRFLNDTTHLTPDMISPLPGAPWAEDPSTGRWVFGTSEYEGTGDCDLKVGQWVKVRGAAAHDGRFMALEVILKAAKKRAGLEGLIQRINHSERSLRIVNKEVVIPHSIPARSGVAILMSLADLHEGDPIKISGRWRCGEFVPEKIKIKRVKGISLEEIEGPIGRIDADSGNFDALGLPVAITERTSVEGLLHASDSSNV